MSHASTTWAMRLLIEPDQKFPNFDLSKLKWLIVALADCEQGTGVAFASHALLSQKTQMDRKTIPLYLGELVRRGLLRDTGERVGRTNQIPVYELVGFDSDAAFARRQFTRPAERKVPVGGELSGTAAKSDSVNSQAPDSADDLDGISPGASFRSQSSPSAGTFGNDRSAGRSPSTDGKVPVGEQKGPRGRGTELSLNGVLTPDARASSRGARAAREPEQPKTIDPAEQRRYWRARFVHDLVEEIGFLDRAFARQPFADLPSRLRQMVDDAAEVAMETFGSAERTRAMEDSLQAEARAQARDVLHNFTRAAAA